VEISLALVLTTGAGLMIRSFLRLQSIDAGFETRNLMTFQIQFPYGELMRLTGASTPSGSAAMVLSPHLYMLGDEIRQRLSGIPGVQSATAGITPPLSGGSRGYTFTIEGKPAPASESEAFGAAWFPVFPGYFRTLGIPLIRGRDFTAQDTAAGLPVVLINQAVAHRIFPREDPIGKRIQVGYYNDPPRRIVGIVGDARQVLREREVSTQLFIPYAQLPLQQEARTGDGLQVITFIVRSRLESTQLIPALRSAVADVDRTLALASIQSVESYASRQLLEQWAYVTLLGSFGAIAVLLAIVGIYGVMTHSVTQRTGEIGVRVALGASSGQVLGAVLQRGLILIGIGITIGFAASLALTRIIQRVLWGVTATDPLTFSLAIGVIAVVAALACWIPARRALKIDPLIALRCE